MGGILEYLREFHFASVMLRLLLAMIIGGCIGARTKTASRRIPHIYAGLSRCRTDRAAQPV